MRTELTGIERTATPERIRVAMEALEAASGGDYQWAKGYAEPGHDQPDRGIVFADWNPPAVKRVGDLLEKLGFELEWSDEWTTCNGCGRAIRTEPDHYRWLPQYKYSDGGVDCKDCLLEDPESYVSDYLLNNDDNADTFGIDLEALGFRREATNMETGLHPGQNDRPADYVGRYPDRDVVFQLDSVGQFDTRWSVWSRPYDYEGAS